MLHTCFCRCGVVSFHLPEGRDCRILPVYPTAQHPTCCDMAVYCRELNLEWANRIVIVDIVVLRCFITPSDIRSASGQTQCASDLASDLRSEAPFHSKQIHRTRDPGLLWSQSMVPSLCFQKRKPFFAHNFKRKSTRYSILSLQVASLSSATSCC